MLLHLCRKVHFYSLTGMARDIAPHVVFHWALLCALIRALASLLVSLIGPADFIFHHDAFPCSRASGADEQSCARSWAAGADEQSRQHTPAVHPWSLILGASNKESHHASLQGSPSSCCDLF